MLPSSDKLPLQFLRQVLAGEKKVNINIYDLMIAKRIKVIELIVHRYHELSGDKLWLLVKSVEVLACYFPDYNENKLPDRKFMFAILATFRFDQLDSMIRNANKN